MPDDLPDYYQVLGVLPAATIEEIYRAYQKWRKFLPRPVDIASEARKIHAQELKPRVEEAFKVLSNPYARKLYDALRCQRQKSLENLPDSLTDVYDPEFIVTVVPKRRKPRASRDRANEQSVRVVSLVKYRKSTPSAHIFRPRPGAWLSTILILILLVTFTIASIFLDKSLLRYVGFIFGLVMIITTVRNELIPMLRTWISIDDEALSGQMKQGAFKVHWKNIAVARIFKDLRNQSHLFLVVSNDALDISLKYLASAQTWQMVQEHIIPTALDDKTYAHWLGEDENPPKPDLETANPVQNPAISLRVRPKRWVMLFGCFGLVLFLSGTVMSLLARAGGGVTIIFLLFAAIESMLVLPNAVVMDSDAVTLMIPLFGRFRIRWSEIRKIETDPMGSWLIFYGENKRLAIMGPLYWSGKDGL
jgi:hypothetical protein